MPQHYKPSSMLHSLSRQQQPYLPNGDPVYQVLSLRLVTYPSVSFVSVMPTVKPALKGKHESKETFLQGVFRFFLRKPKPLPTSKSQIQMRKVAKYNPLVVEGFMVPGDKIPFVRIGDFSFEGLMAVEPRGRPNLWKCTYDAFERLDVTNDSPSTF